MKYRIHILVFILLWVNISAQNIRQENIPAVVLNSFQLKFPTAEDIKWKLVEEDYEVICKVNDKKNIVILDYKGRILKYHRDLYVSEIPQFVLETIRSKVTYFDVNDVDKIEEGGKTIYELNYKIRGKRRFFWIDGKGQLIKYRKELEENEIPSSIKKFIKTKYGWFNDINRLKYVEENGNKYYILAGKINDRDHIFLLDEKIKLLEHHQKLKTLEVPKSIMKILGESYKGYDIRDIDLTEKGGEDTYKIRLKKSGKNVYITLNPEGKILLIK